MEKRKIDILGLGNMGSAILDGIKNKENFLLRITDTDSSKLEKKEYEKIEKNYSLDNLDNIDILFIAIKPQVLRGIKSSLNKLNPKLVISIVAGVDTSELKTIFPTSPIVRFMPNLAASIKSSVTAICYSPSVKENDKKIVKEIASSFGSYFELDENLFDAFIGISGSGIAYIFSFINALSLAGVKEGLSYQESLNIVLDTLEAASKLVKESGEHPEVLLTKVCSPSGTTIEGVEYLEKEHFTSTVMGAVSSSANRSRELRKK